MSKNTEGAGPTTSKVSFLDKIKSMKQSSFKFISFVKHVGSPDPEKGGARHTYLTFELETPIPKVISSHTEYIPSTRQRVNDFETDVTSVNCSLDHIALYENEFIFDEDAHGNLTKAGSYSGDMFLDLSRSRKVWLTDTKLSQQSAEFKQDLKSQRLQKLING